ncbi:MAG: NAD(P)-dependent oxidoreductase [Bacteroidales bacterium]|nr:NAD(P)-dependent oxidoreductase [Bacteroidales bacterium]
MKSVLVIGGSGFSARYLVKELLRLGYQVFAIENRNPVQQASNIHVISGGVRAVTRHLIDELRPEVVFHFARPRFPRLKMAGRILAARLAALQNHRLMGELERTTHPCRLIFASGSLMYGSSPSPLDEDSPLQPVSFARQYYYGEKPILDALQAKRYPIMLLRFPWLLGAGSWFEWFYLRPLKKAHSVPLFGKGDNYMEVLDVEDSARLSVKYAFQNNRTGIFNIISAGPVTQLAFARAVSDVSGFPVKDYRTVFPGHLEKEALQAFASNIILKTNYPDLLKDQPYTPLKKTLAMIFQEFGML